MANCSKCGSELQENIKFCSKCGTPVVAETLKEDPIAVAEKPIDSEGTIAADDPAVVDEGAVVASEVVADSIVSPVAEVSEAAEVEESVTAEEPVVTDSDAPLNAVKIPDSSVHAVSENVPAPVAKKKKRGWLIALCIVLGVSLVLGVLGYIFYPKIARMAMGEVKYALTQEMEALYNIPEEMRFAYSLWEAYQYGMSGTIETVLEVEGQEISIPTIEISQQINGKEKKALLDLQLKQDGKKLISAQILQDRKQSAIQFCDEEETRINWCFDEENSLFAEGKLEEITGMTEKEFRNYMNTYIDVISDNIPEENIQQGEDEIDGKKFTTVTFVLNEDIVMDAWDGIADLLEDDNPLIDVFANVKAYLENHDVEELPSEFQMFLWILTLTEEESAEDLIAELLEDWPDSEELKESFEDLRYEVEYNIEEEFEDITELSYTIYYDARGNSVGYKTITETKSVYSDTESSYNYNESLLVTYKDGDSYHSLMRVTSRHESEYDDSYYNSDNVTEVRADYKLTDSVYVGSFTVDVMTEYEDETETESYEYQPICGEFDFTYKTVGGVELLVGSMEISVYDEEEEPLGSLTLESSSDKDDYDVEVDLLIGENGELAKIGLKGEFSYSDTPDVSDVNLDQDVGYSSMDEIETAIEKLQEIISEIDFEGVVDQLSA